jgi:hypothetical protein
MIHVNLSDANSLHFACRHDADMRSDKESQDKEWHKRGAVTVR